MGAWAGRPRGGGVLVIHENRGLTDSIRTIAGRLAGADTPRWRSTCCPRRAERRRSRTSSRRWPHLSGTASRFVADMKAGVTEIRRRLPGKKVAATGFCFGGGMTWLLLASKESRLAAAVPFYGPFPEGGNLAGSKAAVLGIYAELDSRVNASRAAARAALRKAGLRHQIVTYPGVDHAFFNPTERGTIRRSRGRVSPDGELVRDVRCERVGRASVSVSRCSRCRERRRYRDGRDGTQRPRVSSPGGKPAPRRRAARDGGVWYTAQGSGELGWLDPKTGRTRHVRLGSGSAPHGVIVGPDGAPWITDSGLNAIVRVDPNTRRVRRFRRLRRRGTPT